LTNCDFTLLPCPNKCKEVEQLLRKDIEKHKMECLRRQYDCPHCQEAGEYGERTTSHLDECPMIEVPCSKRECKESILRRNIIEHLSECMFEEVHCKYANIGCEEKVVRRDLHQLEKHEGESQQHLQLAIDAVQQQQRAISDIMTTQIQSLQKKQLKYKFTNFDHDKRNDYISHPEFYSKPGGYKIDVKIVCNGYGEAKGTHVSVYARSWPKEGANWPFTGTVTIELLNQLADKNHHSKTTIVNADRVTQISHPLYISHSDLDYNEAKNCQYLKDDCLYFRVTVVTEKSWLVV
jgi:TNF receptor-associated factor 4